MNSAKKIALLVTPIAEMTDAEVEYIVANRAELNALLGTPEHIAAIHERSAADYAKKVAAKKAAADEATAARVRARRVLREALRRRS